MFRVLYRLSSPNRLCDRHSERAYEKWPAVVASIAVFYRDRPSLTHANNPSSSTLSVTQKSPGGYYSSTNGHAYKFASSNSVFCGLLSQAPAVLTQTTGVRVRSPTLALSLSLSDESPLCIISTAVPSRISMRPRRICPDSACQPTSLTLLRRYQTRQQKIEATSHQSRLYHKHAKRSFSGAQQKLNQTKTNYWLEK